MPPAPLSWGCRGAPQPAGDCPVRLHLNHSFSSYQEDVLFARSFFCDVCAERRSYVEIGALDGFRFSNTLMLERELNFGGLLIEGHPMSASCLERSRGPSGRNVIIKEAVCSPAGTLAFSGTPDGVAGDRSTMSEASRGRWASHHNRLNFTVSCRPIGEMLRQAGLQSVHLFSLDVEGAELRVLQTMDWTIPVHVWSIELDGSNPPKDHAVRTLMLEHGYVFNRRIRINEVFVHADLVSSAQRRQEVCGGCIASGPRIWHNKHLDKGMDAAVAQEAMEKGRSKCFA
jgi:FkbM family methyltransferase